MMEMPEDNIERMTEEQLDAELRKYGLDPTAVIQNAFSKICEVARAQSKQLAKAEADVQHVAGNANTLNDRLNAAEEQVRILREALMSAEELDDTRGKTINALIEAGIAKSNYLAALTAENERLKMTLLSLRSQLKHEFSNRWLIRDIDAALTPSPHAATSEDREAVARAIRTLFTPSSGEVRR